MILASLHIKTKDYVHEIWKATIEIEEHKMDESILW